MMLRGWAIFAAILLLTACSTGPDRTVDPTVDGYPENAQDVYDIPDAVPRTEPPSKYGNPVSYTVLGKTYRTLGSSEGFVERGLASFYGTKFHGRRTSSGDPYDMYAMTAAHKTLPLPTYVKVTNLDNDRSVVVKVNDRGPFHRKRIIDLSYAAAAKLDITMDGTGRVEISAINPDKKTARKNYPPGQHFVQAGAFSQRKNAESLEQRLRVDYGREIDVQQSRTGGKTLYRVYLGPFESGEEARKLASDLRGAGIIGAHTVVD